MKCKLSLKKIVLFLFFIVIISCVITSVTTAEETGPRTIGNMYVSPMYEDSVPIDDGKVIHVRYLSQIGVYAAYPFYVCLGVVFVTALVQRYEYAGGCGEHLDVIYPARFAYAAHGILNTVYLSAALHHYLAGVKRQHEDFFLEYVYHLEPF